MMCENKYKAKGTLNFVHCEEGICYLVEDYPEKLLDFYETTIFGELMTGQEFYDDVDSGYIIDYDGTLGCVFVNGYRSNLGLHHGDLSQGGFLVDGPTWLDICEEFTVEVEWCNK